MNVKLVSVTEEPVKVVKKFYTITVDDEAMGNIIASIDACEEFVDEEDFREQTLLGNLNHIRPELDKAAKLRNDLIKLVKNVK